MTDLIQWPEIAKVDRIIPKERLYTEASAGAVLKQRFVDEVQRVRWAFKLGEESLRLAPGETVTEIQVFVVDLKGSSLDNSVLASIDKAIPSQIIFELRRDDGLWIEQAMAAAYKRAGGRTKGTDYFRTGWVGSDQPRIPLPAALDMDGLYGQLLGRLLPHPIRPRRRTVGRPRQNGTHPRAHPRDLRPWRRSCAPNRSSTARSTFADRSRQRTAELTELTDPVPSMTRNDRGEAQDALARPDPAQHRGHRGVVPDRRDRGRRRRRQSRSAPSTSTRSARNCPTTVVEGPQERYQLDWPGKRAAAFAANAPIAKTLRPLREESVDFDTTKNLFIEGDNLDALKLLQESYLGKVKLIYIDPPYNTGGDFVYDDDFAESRADYLRRSGQTTEWAGAWSPTQTPTVASIPTGSA